MAKKVPTPAPSKPLPRPAEPARAVRPEPVRAASPEPVRAVRAAPAPPPKPQHTAPVKLPGAASKVQLDLENWSGDEHRMFPRAAIHVPFQLWIGDGDEKRFTATLRSYNLSVSGAFIESTFFLPVGTALRLSFQLDENEPAIEASAEIIRLEQPDPRTGQGRSGFAIRFTEFFAQTEVALAKLFLGEQLRGFAEMYLNSARAKSLKSEFERVVDALAAWELQKVTTSADIWKKD